jgi:hypothetical protein
MAEAIEWVSRIITVAIMMVAPGLGGFWLDQQWGTRYLGLAGFVIGLPCGMYYLLSITRVVAGSSGRDISGEHQTKDKIDRERDREE